MRSFGRPAANAVLNALDATPRAGFMFGRERATIAFALHQVASDMAELGREILVDEQNVHRRTTFATGCEARVPRLPVPVGGTRLPRRRAESRWTGHSGPAGEAGVPRLLRG